MKAYLINNDATKVVDRFESVKAAEVVGLSAKYDFSIITDECDLLKLYTGAELAKLFNQYKPENRGEIERFRDKGKGAADVWAAIEATDSFQKGRKATYVPGEIKRPKEGGKTAQVWAIADKLAGTAGVPSRADVVAACEQAGINAGTASTQYQRWRQFNQ